jgi:small GTP-binding protein
MVGDTSVGKTSILARYHKGRFIPNSTPTVALEFCAKVVNLKDGTRVKALIWDTAGQEKYKSVISQHYRKAFGALLVYDVTRKETFQAVQRFLNDLRQWSEPDCVIYLVGNKVDLLESELRAVPLDEVKEYSSRNKLKYMETSAYSDYNVSDCFYKLLEGKLLNF